MGVDWQGFGFFETWADEPIRLGFAWPGWAGKIGGCEIGEGFAMHDYLRPWKLLTLAIGVVLLLAGSVLTPAPDWDVGISLIMAGFTYLFAGWSMRVVLARRWRQWPAMLLATWWCVDGCYALYWLLLKPEVLPLMRDANWPASLALYWTCGLIWFYQGSLRDLYRKITAEREATNDQNV